MIALSYHLPTIETTEQLLIHWANQKITLFLVKLFTSQVVIEGFGARTGYMQYAPDINWDFDNNAYDKLQNYNLYLVLGPSPSIINWTIELKVN